MKHRKRDGGLSVAELQARIVEEIVDAFEAPTAEFAAVAGEWRTAVAS